MNNPYEVLGVPETATDQEVKKAYLNLARKYHPDNYHDNPLADLAQEKMKEINAAYEQVNQARGNSHSGSSSNANRYRGAASGSQNWGGSSGSSVLQQVRVAIASGNIARAEGLLANYSEHNAEWNFLKGAICYRRGWMDEAKRYYQTACQMDPSNMEYRTALNYMENSRNTAYRPNGGQFGTDVCGAGASPLCCPCLCYLPFCC